MATKPPTLIDSIYQLACQKEQHWGWVSNSAMRRALFSARRFVLDDEMSAFLGNLATEAFIAKKADGIDGAAIGKTPPSMVAAAEQMRISARAPHHATWVEFNLRKSLQRSQEVKGRPPLNVDDCPLTEGWLIEQHPQLDYAFRCHLFFSSDKEDSKGFDHWVFPFCYGWTVNDQPLPWKEVMPEVRGVGSMTGQDMTKSEIFTGLIGYKTDKIDIVESNLLVDIPADMDGQGGRQHLINLLAEWSGAMRRVLAFLATINDVPVLHKEVRASRGFMANRNYHRFLDHKVITLHVPQTSDLRKMARYIVAAVRRRAHQVRGHWRADWRFPGTRDCPHLWSLHPESDSLQQCGCGARRFWIHEHQRGDASLGFVTHDYNVTHEEETTK